MVRDRYHRQRLVRGIGDEGQTKLENARVAVVGVGALGTHAAVQLARAGVGFIRLIDRDIVEETNLQRQILFDETDVREVRPKAVAAADKLSQANSGIEVDARVTDLTWENAESLLSDVDLIIDGTDNFGTRRLMNDVSIKHRIPWVYGGCVSSYGSCALFIPDITPCFVCVFGDDTGAGIETCDTVGVLSPAVAIVASTQAAEALKWLTGNMDERLDGVLHIDVWQNHYDIVGFPQANPDCPCCGSRIFNSLVPHKETTNIRLCGRETVQIHPSTQRFMRLSELAARLRAQTAVRANQHLLQCVLDDLLVTVFADGRALIQGTEDEGQALRLYRRYIGG
jgi:molybdopterin-synthase adenylyltransferase